VDAGLPEIAEIVFVLLDLLIPPGQIERDLLHVMNAGISDVVDRDAGIGVPLLNFDKALCRAHVRRRAYAHVAHAELLQEEQLVGCGVGAGLGAYLNSRGELRSIFGGFRCPGVAGRFQEGAAAEGCAESGFAEFTTIGIGHAAGRVKAGIRLRHSESPFLRRRPSAARL
jgi:hypothetical protein